MLVKKVEPIMKFSIAIVLLMWLANSSAYGQTDNDIKAIKETLDSWNQGWARKDVTLAIQDYAEDIDWTNAFGDRFKSRTELKKGLEFIFRLDFVMAGASGENEFEDVMFLKPDVALFRSKLIRRGQKTAAGETMPDRHIHHLRVLQRMDGEWRIVSHLISQSHEKTMVEKENDK